jgi:hypothetical protein
LVRETLSFNHFNYSGSSYFSGLIHFIFGLPGFPKERFTLENEKMLEFGENEKGEKNLLLLNYYCL